MRPSDTGSWKPGMSDPAVGCVCEEVQPTGKLSKRLKPIFRVRYLAVTGAFQDIDISSAARFETYEEAEAAGNAATNIRPGSAIRAYPIHGSTIAPRRAR
jgi:hypothetical protein